VSDYKPTAAEVKQLREATQAGMMDCRNALVETRGDMDDAIKRLREKGIASAGKRAGRGTGEGTVATYVHAGGRIGAMVEGRPEAMLDKIADGMFKKALVDTVLLNQPSIHPDDDGKTIETLRAELSGTLGENIEVKRFARFEVGGA
jgi:elongation factor Ts